MKRPYESMVVFDGTLPEDILQKEQKIIEDMINNFGELEKTDIWGKKTLAFPIRKKRTGYYCLFLFNGSGDFASTLDKHVKLNEKVLRHLTLIRNVKNDEARLKVAQRKERAAPESDKAEENAEAKTKS